MYKKLIASNQSTTDGAENTVTNATPKSEAVKDSTPVTSPKAPHNAKGLTMNKLFNAMSLMAETMDEELGIRDKRLDRLDGDLLDHEERLSSLEKASSAIRQSDDDFYRRLKGLFDGAGGSPATQKETASDTSSVTPKAEKTHEPIPAGYTGPGKAYKYWDYKTRTFGLVSKVFAAKQVDPSYDIVHVWYENGLIHHILDEGEIKKYLP